MTVTAKKLPPRALVPYSAGMPPAQRSVAHTALGRVAGLQIMPNPYFQQQHDGPMLPTTCGRPGSDRVAWDRKRLPTAFEIGRAVNNSGRQLTRPQPGRTGTADAEVTAVARCRSSCPVEFGSLSPALNTGRANAIRTWAVQLRAAAIATLVACPMNYLARVSVRHASGA
jgi:hypothetical protein